MIDKMKGQFLIRFSALCMVSLFLVLALADREEKTAAPADDDWQMDVNYFDKQGEGLQVFQKMQSIYGSMDHFPDFYAGDYLDPVSGDLIILTCNAQQSELESLKLSLQTENVTFRPIKYSMKELKSSCDWLMEQFDRIEEKNEEGYPICPLAVANPDVMANRIRVEIYDSQENGVPLELQKVLERIDEEMIEIVYTSVPREL